MTWSPVNDSCSYHPSTSSSARGGYFCPSRKRPSVRCGWNGFPSGWKSQRLSTPLDPILEQLERRRGLEAYIEDARPLSAREGTQLVETQRELPSSLPRDPYRLRDHLQAVRSDFSKELERDVQPLASHPSDRPSGLTQSLE